MSSISGGNLPRVKVSNQAAIRRIIYEYGPITRAEVSRRLSLTLPTITTNINSLISLGQLRELDFTDNAIQTVGRKAYLVDFVSDSKYFIGVEVRKHTRHLCVTDYRGNVLCSKLDDRRMSDYDLCIRSACGLINEVLASDIIPEGKMGGIGVCFAGIIDPDTGILVDHPQNNWSNKDVIEDIRRLTDYEGPISIENNTLARAYGTQLFKSASMHGINSFTYFYIFTGIACPLILNTTSDLSSPVGPGEVGHMVVDPYKPTTKRGNLGTLENISSEAAIIDSCLSAMQNGEAPILKALCPNRAPSFTDILEAQEKGDKRIDEIVKNALYFLAIASANIDNFIRPDLMFIEGRIFASQSNRDYFLNVTRENQFRSSDSEASIVFLDYNDFSGAKGSCALAIRTDLATYMG